MADEPSWDDIFAGTPSEKRTTTTSRRSGETADEPEQGGHPLQGGAAQSGQVSQSGQTPPVTPTVADPGPSRRDLRAQREEEERRRGRAAPRKAERSKRAPQASAEAAAPPPTAPVERRRSRWRKPGTWILIAVLLIVVGGGGAVISTLYKQYAPGIQSLFGGEPDDDYAGSGNGTKVEFTIVSGDIGETIASKLAKAGVTKTSAATYSLLLANKEISFQPGTYSMFEHMSAQSAIDRLQSTSARITTKIVIPEGTTLKGIISLTASATKIPIAKVKKAAADYKSFDLPSNATSLEGYLFPATYELEPNKTAHAYLQDMVDEMKKRLTAAGVPESKWERTVIFASLIQKEAGLAADYPKVARVFQNRIDDGMLLQSDATVAYGAGTTDRVTTTDAERADASNKYNTYVHKGLPVGPISNPGEIAIEAAVKPATGTWVYFVTVDLDSGETVFSTTYAEHQKAVTQFQSWLRAHPEYQ